MTAIFILALSCLFFMKSGSRITVMEISSPSFLTKELAEKSSSCISIKANSQSYLSIYFRTGPLPALVLEQAELEEEAEIEDGLHQSPDL